MYNDPKRQMREIRKVLFEGGFPATILLITVNIVTWLMTTLGAGAITRRLIFVGTDWPLPDFWTALTWPLAGNGHPITVFFALFTAYFLLGSLERSWGTRQFTLFFFATALLTAATTWVGGRLLNTPVVLNGLWIALAAPTVAWAILNPREQVGLFFGLATVPALWLAGIAAVLLWVAVGIPFLGLFALSGCAAAWWYTTRRGRGLTRAGESDRIRKAAQRFRPDAPERVSSGGVSPLRWWKERQERKRLENLMRRSGFTDDER